MPNHAPHPAGAHPPEGLVYQEQFLTGPEERPLLDLFAALVFDENRMKGMVARRTALRFGLGYDWDRRVALGDPQPLPD